MVFGNMILGRPKCTVGLKPNWWNARRVRQAGATTVAKSGIDYGESDSLNNSWYSLQSTMYNVELVFNFSYKYIFTDKECNYYLSPSNNVKFCASFHTWATNLKSSWNYLSSSRRRGIKLPTYGFCEENPSQ